MRRSELTTPRPYFSSLAYQRCTCCLTGGPAPNSSPPRLYSLAPSDRELIRCLRTADGLNTITRRGEIGTSLPVFGLRPIRWPFLRTTNEPKEESITVSPCSRQSVISLKNSSTSAADSVRDNPTFLWTASYRSARVTVLSIMAPKRLYWSQPGQF